MSAARLPSAGFLLPLQSQVAGASPGVPGRRNPAGTLSRTPLCQLVPWCFLFLILLPGGLEAEGRPSFTPARYGPSVAPQRVLEEEALRFAGAWVDGDVGGLESMLATEGIRLHVDGDFYPSVQARRAAMALRAFLGKYRPGEVEVMRVSQASGTAPRGFADLQWRTQVAGTGEGVIFTLFVAFTMEETGWTVTEIRVLS